MKAEALEVPLPSSRHWLGWWMVVMAVLYIYVVGVQSQNPNCPSGATPVGPCDQNGICFSGNVCVSGTFCCPPGNGNGNTSNPPPPPPGNGLCSDRASNCANFVQFCREPRYIQCLLNNCQFTCQLCTLAASRGRLNGARPSAPSPAPAPQNNAPQPPGPSFTFEANAAEPAPFHPPPGTNEFAVNVLDGQQSPWTENFAHPQQQQEKQQPNRKSNPNTFHVRFHIG